MRGRIEWSVFVKHLHTRLCQFANSNMFLTLRVINLTFATFGIFVYALYQEWLMANVPLYIFLLLLVFFNVASSLITACFDYSDYSRKTNATSSVFWFITFISLFINLVI